MTADETACAEALLALFRMRIMGGTAHHEEEQVTRAAGRVPFAAYARLVDELTDAVFDALAATEERWRQDKVAQAEVDAVDATGERWRQERADD